MEKYKYLREKEHVKAWVEGGTIPIGWASWYKSETRDGIYTPDENLVYKSNFDIANYDNLFNLGHMTGPLILIGCTNRGERIPDTIAWHYRVDGFLECYSNTFSHEVAARYGDKKACIVIHDIELLKRIFDEQIGLIGEMRACEYTRDHQRGPFLKSVHDGWQDEFRIFWNVNKPIHELETMEKRAFEIELPAGLASEIELNLSE